MPYIGLHLQYQVTLSNNIHLTGIILAGGKGIRLGRNKGLAKLKGKPLIEYVIDNLKQVCSEILISSNTDQCEEFGFKTIPDEFKAKGPMAGIHACLKASSNEHNFVVSVDTPFISPDFIRYMAEQINDNMIAAPWHGKDHYEPLSAYYNKQAAHIMEVFIQKGNYKLQDVFQALAFSAVKMNDKLPFYHPMLFHNINTEDDLVAAEKYLGENHSS